MEELFTRHSGLIDMDKLAQLRVVIVGCGGIGSHTALALARMGVQNLTIIDDDRVSMLNVSSQGFDLDDVGLHKVDAVRNKIMRAVRTIPICYKFRVEDTEEGRKDVTKALSSHGRAVYDGFDVCIMAVDSMKARKDIFNIFAGIENESLIINPSMGGEYLTIDTYECKHDTIYNIIKEFNQAWFSDEEGVQDTCTTKATIYTTLMISSLICKIVKDYVEEKPIVKSMAYDIAENAPAFIFDSEGNDLLGGDDE